MKDVVFKILSLVIPMLLSALRELLTNEQFVRFGDKLLDWAENAIAKEDDWYDVHLLALIGIVRKATGIPDIPDIPDQTPIFGW
jgi:hypothetical protein